MRSEWIRQLPAPSMSYLICFSVCSALYTYNPLPSCVKPAQKHSMCQLHAAQHVLSDSQVVLHDLCILGPMLCSDARRPSSPGMSRRHGAAWNPGPSGLSKRKENSPRGHRRRLRARHCLTWAGSAMMCSSDLRSLRGHLHLITFLLMSYHVAGSYTSRKRKFTTSIQPAKAYEVKSVMLSGPH